MRSILIARWLSVILPGTMAARATKSAKSTIKPQDISVDFALDWLRKHSSKRNRDGMARYAIPSDKALGVSVSDIRKLGELIGRDRALAIALWKTDIYEARMLVPFVADPQKTTAAQMDAWRRDFDNWAVCDALCFHLFDRTPHAWTKVKQWATHRDEFQKRAAFATLWGLTVHDKSAPDAHFIEGLKLIERAATDERNFVKKAVNMALRAIGKRNATLHAEAVATAKRLAASTDPTARWNGKDALRELNSPSVLRRIAQVRARAARA
jgi:3-methyladenine DNA glycosylase AlkD